MRKLLSDLLGAIIFVACITTPFALYAYWMKP
jgi:hypothetical protein